KVAQVHLHALPRLSGERDQVARHLLAVHTYEEADRSGGPLVRTRRPADPGSRNAAHPGRLAVCGPPGRETPSDTERWPHRTHGCGRSDWDRGESEAPRPGASTPSRYHRRAKNRN